MKNTKYESHINYWHVTTEGDEEGRSTKDLGLHYGALDEIAFGLADKCFYGLRFDVYEPSAPIPPGFKVNVSLGIDSGTWDMSPAKRAEFFRKLLPGSTGATVKESNFYACVELHLPDFLKKQTLRQQAIAKLSREELAALGLKP